MDSKQPGNLCYSDKKDNKKCINGMSKIFVKSYSGLVNIFILLDNDSVRVSKYCNFKNIRLFNLNLKFQDVVFRSVLRTLFPEIFRWKRLLL